MTGKLTFSKFKAQEFDSISGLLCDIFDKTRPELELIYKEVINDFGKDGWPSYFVRRDFFKGQHQDFKKTSEISPSIAIDLPGLFESDNGINDKSTIVILGQAPKSDRDSEQISLGTPYGLHHKGSCENLGRTQLYFEIIVALLTLNYRV